MAQMGFGNKWIGWIDSCLRLASISVLINGSPSKDFSTEQGLRQGDPISPFLFLIVVEALQVLIIKACNRGIYKCISLVDDESNISLLQYADDALFFGKWSDLNAKNLIHIPKCFEDALGLTVNLAKSRLFLGLGLPVRRNMHYNYGWSEVVDRFQTRLSSWKANCLSIGGRLTLVNNGVWDDIVKAVKKIELIDSAFKPSFLKKSQMAVTLFLDGCLVRTLDDLYNLINLIGNVSLSGDTDDKWVWTLHSSGALNVKALSSMIQDKVLINFNLGKHHVWNSWVPRKVNVCTWRDPLLIGLLLGLGHDEHSCGYDRDETISPVKAGMRALLFKRPIGSLRNQRPLNQTPGQSSTPHILNDKVSNDTINWSPSTSRIEAIQTSTHNPLSNVYSSLYIDPSRATHN
nr:putative RNA-directed DNA polymerase, eukaryota [Tanacetum cinerariifolium]